MKKAIILINELQADAKPDELDVLGQASLVEDALANLGFKTERLFLGLDLKDCLQRIIKTKPQFVFNLVESFDGKSSLAHIAPSLLESYSIPFTGCGSESMFITTNKLLTKQLLASHGIPTPLWNEHVKYSVEGKKLIIKPVSEEASVGINDSNVVSAGDNSLAGYFQDDNYFIEEFINGREFNISVIESPRGFEVLPPAEILFQSYPTEKPRIVGYAAKWDEDSFEFKNTPRNFDFSSNDKGLIARIKEISAKCWDAFKLSGYARIDFRIDENHNPFVIEINANPCIAPDSGFIAACRHAGMDEQEIIERIIQKL